MNFSETVEHAKRLVEEITEDTEIQTAFLLYLFGRRIEAAVKAKKDKLRDVILAYVDQHGEEDDKGSRHVLLKHGKASKTKKRASQADPEKVISLLESKGLPIEGIVTTKTEVVRVVSPSAFERLLKIGALSSEEYDSVYSVTYALNVSENSSAKELLGGI